MRRSAALAPALHVAVSDHDISMSRRLLDSRAWRALGGNAIRIWLEVLSRFDGADNCIELSQRDAASWANLSLGAVKRSFRDLVEQGFLERVDAAERFISKWRITALPSDGAPPTGAPRPNTKAHTDDSAPVPSAGRTVSAVRRR